MEAIRPRSGVRGDGAQRTPHPGGLRAALGVLSMAFVERREWSRKANTLEICRGREARKRNAQNEKETS